MSDSLWSHGQQHARPPCPSPPPKVFRIHVHCISDDIQPSHPLMPSSPSALNLSQHQELFSSESAIHIGWPKYWSFSFSISPSNEYSGLISFKKEWLDLLAVQGTLRSLLQHHSSKASILWHSVFFFLLRRNVVALIISKRVWNAIHGCSLKNNRMISVRFQGKPFNITVIQV